MQILLLPCRVCCVPAGLGKRRRTKLVKEAASSGALCHAQAQGLEGELGDASPASPPPGANGSGTQAGAAGPDADSHSGSGSSPHPPTAHQPHGSGSGRPAGAPHGPGATATAAAPNKAQPHDVWLDTGNLMHGQRLVQLALERGGEEELQGLMRRCDAAPAAASPGPLRMMPIQ